MPERLLVIDPGLDAMGCAVFDPRGADPRKLERALVWVETIRTATTDELTTRLNHLGLHAFRLARDYECTDALIELPSFTGTYRRNRGAVGRDGMAANMAKLNIAIGYLAGTLVRSCAVTFAAPLSVRKDLKAATARQIVAAAERERKVTLSGRVPSADALDAVALGVVNLHRYAARRPLTSRLTGAT